MAYGDAREGKWRGNWRMEWVSSTLHTTSEHGVFSITTADAHTSAASSRLNWRPRRFKWTRPFHRKTKSCFFACAITFQTQSNYTLGGYLWNAGSMGWVFVWRGHMTQTTICVKAFITDCVGSEFSSGQCFWEWYFSLTSAIKLVDSSLYEISTGNSISPLYEIRTSNTKQTQYLYLWTGIALCRRWIHCLVKISCSVTNSVSYGIKICITGNVPIASYFMCIRIAVFTINP